VLVRIQSKIETDGPWCLVDGWSFAEFEILPRVGELISLQHIPNQGVWLRVDHIVHTPNNVRPTSVNDERPYQAILFVTWLSQDAVIAPGAADDVPAEHLRAVPPGPYAMSRDAADTLDSKPGSARVRSELKDITGRHALPAFGRQPRRYRQ
jgi:hypothetical protein